jgi:TPR repeat protein
MAAVLLAAPVCIGVAGASTDAGAGHSGVRVQCQSKDECFQRATAYEKGTGVAANRDIAAAYYQLACDKGHGPACSELGDWLAVGARLDRDEKRAVALDERACDLGHLRGCWLAANLYRQGSREPGAVPKDTQRAAALLEKGCNAGDGANCSALAYAYRYGEGVKKDKRRAAALEKRAKALGFVVDD